MRKRSKITQSVKVRQVRGRSKHGAARGYRGKKPNARKDSAAPLKPMRQIAHSRHQVIMTSQVKVARPSSRVSPPAKHMTGGEPSDKEKTYPLYSKNGYIGECTIVKVRTSRIARGGMTRFRVAIDGKVVGTAAKVGKHMKLLHR